MDRSFTGSFDPIIPDVRLDFACNFAIEVVRDGQRPGEEIRYFPSDRAGGRDGLLVRVSPAAAPAWTGLFAAEPTGRNICGVYSCPNPDWVCIVANGAMYVLDVRGPSEIGRGIAPPIQCIATDPKAGLLAFANFTDVGLIDGSGVRWIAAQVSFDGITGLAVTPRDVRGLGWSPMEDDFPFSLDVATGVRVTTGTL